METKAKRFLDNPWVQGILAFIAIFSLCWAIFEHFYVPNPRIEFEIVSEVQLFNSSDRVSSINLYIDSLDVKNANLNVSLYNIRISNKGRKHVSTSDYEGESFGVAVEGGKILNETDLLSASNSYIEEAFEQYISESTNSFLDLPQVALDIEDYYEFSIAVLHDNSALPSLTPVGKILGQKELTIVPSTETKELSFFEQVFYGSVWAHLFRILLGMVLVFMIAFLAAIAMEGSEAASEKRHTKAFLNDITTSKKVNAFIKEDILSNGVGVADFAYECIKKGEEEMERSFDNAQKFIKVDENLLLNTYDTYRHEFAGYKNLFKRGYLVQDEEGRIIIPDGVKESVELIHSLMKKYHLHQFSIKRNLPE